MSTTKEMFLEQHGGDRSDKWCVEFIDGSSGTYKHVYGGAEQLAVMVNWPEVKVSDGEVCAGSI